MTPERLRAYVLIVMRDILIPGAGVFLCVWLPLTAQLSPWHLPLLAAMLGTPLVARADTTGLPGPEQPVEAEAPAASMDGAP